MPTKIVVVMNILKYIEIILRA